MVSENETGSYLGTLRFTHVLLPQAKQLEHWNRTVADVVAEAQTFTSSGLKMTHVLIRLSLLFELAKIEGAKKIDRITGAANLSHDSLH